MICQARRRRHLADDAGMTLVELIVTIVISGILLAGIAVILGQGLSAQQQQAARNSATNQLNAASVYLNESMRSAVAARVSESGKRLDLKVIDSTGKPAICRAWQITDEELKYRDGAGPLGAVGASWPVLASDVVDTDDATVGFTAGSGQNVSYLLNITQGEISVTIRDGGYPGAKSGQEGVSCW